MPSLRRASRPSANVTEVSEALPQGMRFDASSGELDAATRPFQFALKTRAGTDSLAAIACSCRSRPRATVVSLDGRSAYDTISRAYLPSYAILSRRSCPSPSPCMRAPPLICGGTTRDECTTSRRLKVSSKGTL